MSNSEPTNVVKNRCVSEQMGWRLNLIEANVRAIVSHFETFGIEGEEAKKHRGNLEDLLKLIRERFMEATGGK
jgi:hypothetical protein